MDESENSDNDPFVIPSVDDDAVPVCSYCLEPCDPLDYYCPNCESNEIINPLASYMPFVDIRFKTGVIGKLWRKTWAKETALIDRTIFIGLFLLFFPFLFLVGLPFVIYEKIKGTQRVGAADEH